MAIAILFNWLAAFLVSRTFPSLIALAGAGTVYIAYAAAGIVIFPVGWWMVPDLRNAASNH